MADIKANSSNKNEKKITFSAQKTRKQENKNKTGKRRPLKNRIASMSKIIFHGNNAKTDETKSTPILSKSFTTTGHTSTPPKTPPKTTHRKRAKSITLAHIKEFRERKSSSPVPAKTCAKNKATILKELEQLPYYYGAAVHCADLNLLLKNNGDFLVKSKKSDRDLNIVICVKWNEKCRQIIVCEDANLGYSLGHKWALNVIDLIKKYQEKGLPLVTNKQEKAPILKNPVCKKPEIMLEHVTILEKITPKDRSPQDHLTYTAKLKTSVSEEYVKVCVKEWKVKKDIISEAELHKCATLLQIYECYEHPNLAKIFGYNLSPSCQEIRIVLEYFPNGNILNFLRSDQSKSISASDLVKYCLDVADAMEYLQKNAQTHRYLCARNCMLNVDKRSVKVADYGQVFHFLDSAVSGKREIYVKWTPPEILAHSNYKKSDINAEYHIKSDVWSFGIFMWEILSKGGTPYERLTSEESVEFVLSNNRLDPTEKMAFDSFTDFNQLLLSCWELDAKKRPDFSEIKARIEEIYNRIKDH